MKIRRIIQVVSYYVIPVVLLLLTLLIRDGDLFESFGSISLYLLIAVMFIKPVVKILNIKGGYYAVIRYSGRASDKNFTKHKEILKNELKKNNIIILSSAIKATYDKPFTLPMLRRNEAMFKIDINL